MAKCEVNKSALIRDALTANPTKMPIEISELLKADHNLTVPASYISTVKFNMKDKKKARKVAKAAAGEAGDVGALFAAARLVMTAGGVEQAQAALDAVKKVAAILV